MTARGLICLLGYAVAVVGWLLLIAFVAYQYLPEDVREIVPGVVNVLLGAVLAYVFGL